MQFYFLNDLQKVGKIEDFVPYLHDKGKGWMVENDNLLMDRIVGYDGESIGSSDLFKVEEITEEQANKKINEMDS